MTKTVAMAIGTRRSRAETWIRELPDRFAKLGIQTITREMLPDLEGHDVAVGILPIDIPYSRLEDVRSDAAVAYAKGWDILVEYFPAEPLIQLIQSDQQGEHLLGAAVLREDLQSLRPEADYLAALDSLEKEFETAELSTAY